MITKVESQFLKKFQKYFKSTILFNLLFRCSVMPDSVRHHGLQHTRFPCPSPSPGVAQTHVHWVGDAIQPSHPLLSPSPLAFNLSQHQGLFQWVTSLHQVAKLLKFQLQHQSFQWLFGVNFLWGSLVWSPCCPKDSRESSLAPQFKSINPSVFSLSYDSTDHPYIDTGKIIALTRWTSVSKVTSLLFNMLSRLVITFLPRSKWLLISRLQSPSAVILEPPK